MAEVRNDEEVNTLPAKRKPDLDNEDIDKPQDDDAPKKPKLETSSNSSVADETKPDEVADNEDEEEEDYEEDDDNDDDDDADEDDEDEENSNGQVEIDPKGKGIMRDDKGKGKLIEESDDSSDDAASESNGDSDLSDDPLAEVDLDNILPSRTRRRVVRPGVFISNELSKDNDRDA